MTSDGNSLQAAIGREAPDLVIKVRLVVCGGEVFRFHNETDGVGNSLVEEASGVYVFIYAY